MQPRERTRAHARAPLRPVPETMAAGGAEELLFCHAWLRFTRTQRTSREKPARLNVSGSPQARTVLRLWKDGFHSSSVDDCIDYRREKVDFFANFCSVESWDYVPSLWLLVFPFVSLKCHRILDTLWPCYNLWIMFLFGRIVYYSILFEARRWYVKDSYFRFLKILWFFLFIQGRERLKKNKEGLTLCSMNYLLIVGFMFYILISLTQNLSKENPRTEIRTSAFWKKKERSWCIRHWYKRDYSRVRMIRCDLTWLRDAK